MTPVPPPTNHKPPRFIPLMVRFITPLNLILVIIAVIGVFLLTNALSSNVGVVEENLLIQSTIEIAEGIQIEYNQLLQETQRVAFTQGLVETTIADDAEGLRNILEPIAIATNLDSLIVTDTNGQEIIGLLRNDEANEYSLSQNTNLADETLVRSVLNTTSSNEAGLLQTPNGVALYVATPIQSENGAIGIVLGGRYVTSILDTLQNNSLIDVTLYSGDSRLLESTLEIADSNRVLIDVSQDTVEQTLSNANQVTLAEGMSVNGQDYRVAFIPFTLGEKTLGVFSIMMEDNVAFATAGGRQISAFLMAILAGAITFVAVISINFMTRRIEQVTETVDALASGQNARVEMQATDEIGQMATAVNRYADVVQEREDQFRTSIRRHRRQRDYLLLAFEAIPEGVIVQDTDGRVVLMNDPARELLGSQRVFRSTGLHELTTVLNSALGNSIAPGLYALGNPQQIKLDEKMLLAQASAIVVGNGQRLGSVVLLRDITLDVQREQARENILSQITEDIQKSLQNTSRQAMQHEDKIVRRLARDVAKHASALQSMIVEMRELTQYAIQQDQQIQRSLSSETLLWGVANDWRQIAHASDIALSVILEERGLFILGDEQRLRYALGNIVDNAIKYTESGGKISLEIRGEHNGMVRIRIRDNGVGISDEDMPHIFVRYYRGQPSNQGGNVVHVPGMGQGLTDTQQIINAHGGDIRIKSIIGVGTASYITLPSTASTSYQLPLIEDDVMEGETMLIPDHVSIDQFWDGHDQL